MLIGEQLEEPEDEYAVCSAEDAWADDGQENAFVEEQQQLWHLGSRVHGGASSSGSKPYGFPCCYHGILSCS